MATSTSTDRIAAQARRAFSGTDALLKTAATARSGGGGLRVSAVDDHRHAARQIAGRLAVVADHRLAMLVADDVWHVLADGRAMRRLRHESLDIGIAPRHSGTGEACQQQRGKQKTAGHG